LHGRSRKFDWIIDKVVEIHGQGEKVVIFSQFLDMLNLLEGALRKRSIDYVRLDGSTRGRQRIIDHYNDADVTAALCSLRATSFGINLQSANHVIHADRWWNPAVEDQATDRVHRIGQKRIVYVYRIINEGTLEERIDKLLLAKRGMADRILKATDQKRRSWTREELIDILKPLDT
jgi:SNF2 family DNA or RNA helicase